MRHDSTRQRLEQPRLNFNEEAIKAEYKNLMHDGNHKAIRILLILGSLLSSAFVLGLLSVLGLYDTPGAMLTVGLAGLVSGVWIHRMGKKDVLDAFSVSFVVIGYASFLFSISEWRGSATEVCVAAGLLSAALFFFTRSYLFFRLRIRLDYAKGNAVACSCLELLIHSFVVGDLPARG
jgi:hypothetical protein